MRFAGPIVVCCLLLLAGCAGRGRDEPGTDAVVADPAKPAELGTMLRVLVVSDEFLPVIDARVKIVGVGVDSTTDEGGNAYFQILRTGRYSVHVNHARFYPNVTKVDVADIHDQVLRIMLRDAPRDGYYSDFYYFEGICAPTVYVKAVTESGDCRDTPFFPRTAPRWILGAGLVDAFFQLEWAKPPGGADAMRIEVALPEAGAFADGSTELAAEGPSPVKLKLRPELVTPPMKANGNRLVLHIGLAEEPFAGATAYQDFTLIAQVNYFVPAPDVDPET